MNVNKQESVQLDGEHECHPCTKHTVEFLSRPIQTTELEEWIAMDERMDKPRCGETLHTVSDIEKALEQGYILARYHKLSPDNVRCGWIPLSGYRLKHLGTEDGKLSARENIKIIGYEDELTDRNILDILCNIKCFHSYWNNNIQHHPFMCSSAEQAYRVGVITLNEHITAKEYIDKIIESNLINIRGYTEQDIKQLKKENRFDTITLGESLGLRLSIETGDTFHEEVKKW